MKAFDDLYQLLSNLSPTDVISDEIFESLKASWDYLGGSGIHKTTPDKLYRAENFQWNSPILSFQIERHGGMVNGSTRAEIDHWQVNIETQSAKIVSVKRLQLKKSSPRLDTKKLAQETADLILNYCNHDYLIWKEGGHVVIDIGEVIPETNAQTTEGRRKRYKTQLVEIMAQEGWTRKDLGRRIGFIKSQLAPN